MIMTVMMCTCVVVVEVVVLWIISLRVFRGGNAFDWYSNSASFVRFLVKGKMIVL